MAIAGIVGALLACMSHIQVVVAFDFTPSSEQALHRALDVACRAPQHILHIVAALDPHHGLPVLATRVADFAYAEKIQQLISGHVREVLGGRDAMAVEFFVHARLGHAADEILALASDVGADLVFIGSNGTTGLERLLLGSVSTRVVREAKCPVMVVRDKTYKHVTLLHVVESTAEHKPQRAPFRFSYVNHQIVPPADDWPHS
jgi:nucleotide-binding universal stress UspA family protein